MPPVLSVTVTVSGKVPAWVGMPLKVRDAALNVRPLGSVPVWVTVYGAMPPAIVSACE